MARIHEYRYNLYNNIQISIVYQNIKIANFITGLFLS